MSKKELNNPINFLLYTGGSGDIRVDVRLEGENLWLTQTGMAELFDTTKQNIGQHLKKIFKEQELAEDAVVKNFFTTAEDGKNYQTRHYNLDAIISVGYRVNSRQATQFRIWATRTLKEYIIKGFVLDDKRLKQGGKVFGKDYFDELLERIREIRASERRFYQKITDIYALSADYDPDAPITKDFFATVQNTLHWAITGKTAAEIIYEGADSSQPNMGLTSWKNAPEGKILKSDTSVAKNYLSEQHIKELERIVSSYLDLAESRAERGIVMAMRDWIKFLEQFLELSNYPILNDKGKISAEAAKVKADQEYEIFRIEQDKTHLSDFDKVVKKISTNRKKP